MSETTIALEEAASLTEKFSRARSLAKSNEVPRAFAEEQVQSMKTREASMATSTLEERPRTVSTGYGAIRSSVFLAHLAHKSYKSALENSCCCWAEDGPFFDARSTW